MYHVPVAARRNGHLAVQEILVKLVERSRRTRPASRDNGGTYLHAFHLGRHRIEQAVQKTRHRAADGSEIDGRAKDDAVGLPELPDHLVHQVIIKHTLSQRPTLPTADAATDILMPHVDDFRLDAILLQHTSHHTQGRECTAMSVRTSVD